LNRLVENLLDMTRLESGLIKPRVDWCDVRDLINAAVAETSAELAHYTLDITAPPGMLLIKIDFALMEQVLTNLLINAALYTPEGSTIQIKASSERGHCVIEVADNGPGLPPDALERIFDKFFRVPGSKTGGTGLGLSIARGFVQAHNGTIAAENRAGGGLKFVVRIPLEEVPGSGAG